MKIFHLSDLHIGKQLHFYNMKQDQIYILEQIVKKAVENKPDVIIIAGDIFDKSAPSAEAYDIFDRFLNQLADIEYDIPILIIAGNHDSPQRLNYASSFLEKHNIYISTMPPVNEDEYIQKIILKDEFGDVAFYMLPFTKPSFTKKLFDDDTLTYEETIRKLLERENIDYSKRNVIISHQFYKSGTTTVELSDSEQVSFSVGGLDCVDVSIIEKFDYAALGHIHKAQKVGKDYIRYSGTPLKYSISEANHKKSISVVNLKEKGNIKLDNIKLEPIRDVVTIKGEFKSILANAKVENINDYVSITLTDDIEPFRPKERLEEVYYNILEIKLDNDRIRKTLDDTNEDITSLQPLEAFEEFYEQLQGNNMSDTETNMLKEIMEEIVNEID